MDEYTFVLLILAVFIGAPLILFYLGERANRAMDEDRKRGKPPPQDSL